MKSILGYLALKREKMKRKKLSTDLSSENSKKLNRLRLKVIDFFVENRS